jgi:hypothetical protein
MKTTIANLRKIIREEVSRVLNEATVDPRLVRPAVNAARYLQANYSADLEELVALRDANRDMYKFKAAVEESLGEKNMSLGLKLMDFWMGSRGMSAEDLQMAIDAPEGHVSDYRVGSEDNAGGRNKPNPMAGGGFYTGD